jgi:hypothetical protein
MKTTIIEKAKILPTIGLTSVSMVLVFNTAFSQDNCKADQYLTALLSGSAE